jgi:acyl-CoA thioester hydrolase
MHAVALSDMNRPEHHFDVRVYWEDTDAGGVVFFANYLKFLERARTEWLRQLGFSQETWRATGSAFVVSQLQIRYLQPARLDDLLHIATRLKNLGQASFTLNQQARRGSALLCESEVRLGFVDISSLRPQRLPADFLSQIA